MLAGWKVCDKTSLTCFVCDAAGDYVWKEYKERLQVGYQRSRKRSTQSEDRRKRV